MSTNQTIPTILEPSAEIDYAIVCWVPEGDEGQRENLTLEEYGALRRHLAGLRGLIPDTETTAAQSPSDSKESNDPAIDPKMPGALTLARLVGLHKDSIGILECEIECLTEMVKDGTIRGDYLLGRALDAEVLSDLLQLWNSGGYEAEYPKDGRLLATMKERCTL